MQDLLWQHHYTFLDLPVWKLTCKLQNDLQQVHDINLLDVPLMHRPKKSPGFFVTYS